MQLKKVLICDNVAPVCAELLEGCGLQTVTKSKMTKDELLQEIATCDGLIVRSATKVTEDVIKAGKNLQLIGRAGVGVDNIDCKAASENGVIVMNTPTGNSISAAELTCTMIASLSREVTKAALCLKDGKWDRKAFMGEELFGKTLAIVGLGNIGKEVAKRVQAYGMKTIGYDPFVSAESAASEGIVKMELEKLWPLADYITVHTPLIAQTKNLINAEVLSKCKKGVRIINVARGGIVDEKALLEALESGQCGGAGLDVFVEEPPKDLSLVRHSKVIATPHLGANTKEAQLRVAKEIGEQFVDYVKRVPLKGVVNAPALRDSFKKESKSWITLGETLGKCLSAFVEPKCLPTFSVEIVVFGPGPKKSEDFKLLISTAVLVGLMQKYSDVKVNMINAQVLAKQKGVSVAVEYKSAEKEYLGVSFMKNNTPQFSITGSMNGDTVTSYNICGSSFSNGLALRGYLSFFRGDYKSFSDILNELLEGNVVIVSMMRSDVSEKNEVWYVVQSQEALPNLTFSVDCMARLFL